MVVVEKKDSFLYKIVSLLGNIQNDFLQSVLLTGSTATEFLTKGEHRVLSYVIAQNVKEDQIIDCALIDSMPIHGYDKHRYEQDFDQSYNFWKIEQVIAETLVFGKTVIRLDESFPLATYANEMFTQGGGGKFCKNLK